ncbi:hypothetical protein PoB_004533700 [Plakobranchus ocellatus]|uniref:Uncharacterized protein n=1 Tax=Plakobranchus ocellatus TaxID=259542 RepID=A0AAV4BHI5_9GAST|nr:hypothetical protein PoB_004533700 [Plakobranchus ocellatus]
MFLRENVLGLLLNEKPRDGLTTNCRTPTGDLGIHPVRQDNAQWRFPSWETRPRTSSVSSYYGTACNLDTPRLTSVTSYG